MSKTTTFEAWAVERIDGTLCTFVDSPKPMTVGDHDAAERLAKSLCHEEDYELPLKPIRVRVTVETIGEGTDDEAQSR